MQMKMIPVMAGAVLLTMTSGVDAAPWSKRTCKESHNACLATARGEYLQLCNRNYEIAMRTGVWPMYRGNGPWRCARNAAEIAQRDAARAKVMQTGGREAR